MNISRRKFVLSAALLVPFSRLIAGNVKLTTACFLHGVASGDPLQDRVIIWTRITASDDAAGALRWEMATEPGFLRPLKSGNATFSAKTDYTVKVDVKGLEPGCKYYYRFFYQNVSSPVGETQTLPKELNGGDFTMAVVSCSNWEDGYFNSFRFLAQKAEVDLVLHLGDYIYEYASGEYGNPASGRINEPKHEVVTLQDYRTRYAQYRTDPDLQAVHAKKPFYLIWDDHELANDAYKDGAKNHQANEGTWQDRKAAAIQAYLEWMPIRANKASEVRRKFEIGDDISLYLMDERTSDRTKQMASDTPGFYSRNREMIGESQYAWLANELKTSKATWKLIGNQVVFSGYAVAKGFKLPKYNDWWLGYPYERGKILDMLEREKISNTIFLTGDHHESFVMAVHKEDKFMDYTKSYQQKPLAWELLTPSITSKNADRQSKEKINEFETMLYNKEVNPHLVFADIKSHGYLIATISKKKFQTDYYFIDNLLTNQAKEYNGGAFTIDATSFGIS